MKIYTKTGDTGDTSLVGGRRVTKHHIRIEAYGTADELISYIGLLESLLTNANLKKILLEIQEHLMAASSILATSADDRDMQLPKVADTSIEMLEKEIDCMESALKPLYSFILPGGHPVVAHCHIARTICRRAERIIVNLNETEAVDLVILRYFNRLSDYLFVLSRYLSMEYNVIEHPWIPDL